MAPPGTNVSVNIIRIVTSAKEKCIFISLSLALLTLNSLSSAERNVEIFISAHHAKLKTDFHKVLYLFFQIVLFPDSSEVKNLPTMQGLIPGFGRFPWRREWQPIPVFLPKESYGQRSLAGYSPWGHKESDTTGLLTL